MNRSGRRCSEDSRDDALFQRSASVITTTGLWTKQKVHAVATATASPSCPPLQRWVAHVQKDSLSDRSLLAEFQPFYSVHLRPGEEEANTDGTEDATTRSVNGNHDTTQRMPSKHSIDKIYPSKESFLDAPAVRKGLAAPEEEAVESVGGQHHREGSTPRREANKAALPIPSSPSPRASSSSCVFYPSSLLPPPSSPYREDFHTITEVKLEGWEHRNWQRSNAPEQPSGRVSSEKMSCTTAPFIRDAPSSVLDRTAISPCPTTTTTTTTIVAMPRKGSRSSGAMTMPPHMWCTAGVEKNDTDACGAMAHQWTEGKAKGSEGAPHDDGNEKNETEAPDEAAALHSDGCGETGRCDAKEGEQRMERSRIDPTDGLLHCLHACTHLTSLVLLRSNIQSVLYSSLLPCMTSRFGAASASSSSSEEERCCATPPPSVTGIDSLWPFLSQLDRLCIQQEYSSAADSSFLLFPSRRSSPSLPRDAHDGQHSICLSHAKQLQDPLWSFRLLCCSPPPPPAAFTWWLLLSCRRLRTLALTHTTHSAALRMHEVGAVLSLFVDRKADPKEEEKRRTTREEEEEEEESESEVWKDWHSSLIDHKRRLFFRRSISEEYRVTCFCDCPFSSVAVSPSNTVANYTECCVEKERSHHDHDHVEEKRVVLLGMLDHTKTPRIDRASSVDHRDYFPLSLSPSRTFRLFQLTELDLSYTDVSSLTWMRRVWCPSTPSLSSPPSSPLSSIEVNPLPHTTFQTTDRHHNVCCRSETLAEETTSCVDAPKDAAHGEEERAVLISTLPHLRVLRLVGCLELHSLDSLFYKTTEEIEVRWGTDGKKTTDPNWVKRKRDASSRSLLPPLHLPHLHTLDIAGSAVEDLDALQWLASCSRGLRFFSMNGCKKVCDADCLQQFTALRVLHAQHTMLSSLSWIEACTALEEVDLQGCFLLEDVSSVARLPCLKTYFGPVLSYTREEEKEEEEPQKPLFVVPIPLSSPSRFSSLTSLQLQYPGSRDGAPYARETGKEIESALSALSSPLRSLVLEDVPVRTLSFLSFLPQLEKLSLHCCRSLRKQPPKKRRDTTTAFAFGYAPSIEEAPAPSRENTLDQRIEEDDEDDHERDTFSCIASLSHLHDLELSDVALLYVDGFLFPGASCTRELQHVNISLCSGLHDITGVSSCSQLQSITLSDASLSDIQSELQHCPLLTAVHVSYLDLVDEVGCMGTLPLLSHLSIRRTDVQEVSFHVPPRLLHAEDGTLPPKKEHVDDAQPAALACPPHPPHHATPSHLTSALQELSIAECPRLTSLRSLTYLASSLRALHLHHIAVKALEGLEQLYVLEELQIESCASLTTIHCSPSSSSLSGVSFSSSASSSSCRREPLALQSILLHRCPKLCGIGWMTAYAMTAIQEVKIHDCPLIGCLRPHHTEERRKGKPPFAPHEVDTEENERAEWESALQTVVGNNPSLRVLEIVSSFTTCMKSLRAWLLPSTFSSSSSSFQRHSELTEIRFSGLLSLTGIDGVEQLPHLTALSIAQCPRLHSYQALSRCPALVRLQLSACAGITNLFASLCGSPPSRVSFVSSSSSCACGACKRGDVHLQTNVDHTAGIRQEEEATDRTTTAGTVSKGDNSVTASSMPVLSILPGLEVLELSQLEDLRSILPPFLPHALPNEDGRTGVRLARPEEEKEGKKKDAHDPASSLHRVHTFSSSSSSSSRQSIEQLHERSANKEGQNAAAQALQESNPLTVPQEACSPPPLPPLPLCLHFLPCLHTLSISSCARFQNVFSSTPIPLSFANDVDASATPSCTPSTALSWPYFSSPPFFSTASPPLLQGSIVSFASALQLQRVQLADLPMLQDIRWLSAWHTDGTEVERQMPSVASGAPLSTPPWPTSFSFVDSLDVSFCPSLCSLDGVQSLKRLRSLSAIMCSMENLEPLRGAIGLRTLEEVDVSFCALLTDASALLHPPPHLSSSSTSPPPPPPSLLTAHPTSSHQRPASQRPSEQEKRFRKSLHSDPTRNTMEVSPLKDCGNKNSPQKYNSVLKRFRANGAGLQGCQEDFTNKAHCPSLIEFDFGEQR